MAIASRKPQSGKPVSAAPMRVTALLCGIVLLATGYHFFSAIAATGIHQGLGADVFFAGYAANVWQAGIDVDLIAGLLLLSGWIFLRERSWVDALIWVNLLFYWGNFVAAAYVLWHMWRAGSRPDVLLLGHRATAAFVPQPTRVPPWAGVLALLAAIALGVWVFLLCRAADQVMFQMVGYLGGIGCFVPPLLRIGYLSLRPVPAG